MNIDGSSFIPSIDSFQYYIPLTSTPKRSNNKSINIQPLSSTLSKSIDCSKQFELSISAITIINKKSPRLSYDKQQKLIRRRKSTIIKRIELKYLLYSTRAMKSIKQRQYNEAEMKIYVI